MFRKLVLAMAAGAALLAAGCGDDEEGSGGGTAANSRDAREIRLVVKRALVNDNARKECAAYTDAFIKRVYRDRRDCIRKSEDDQDDSDITKFSTPEVDGDRATVDVEGEMDVDGQLEPVSGGVVLARKNGKWLVSDYGDDLARSLFSVLMSEIVRPIVDSGKVADCVKRRIADLDAAEASRLFFGMARDDDRQLARAFAVVDGCGPGELSLSRAIVEQGLKEALEGEGAPRAVVDCVISRLRREADDAEVRRSIPEGEDGPATARLRRIAERAVAGCARRRSAPRGDEPKVS